MRLTGARDEQAWIAEHIVAGVDRAQLAVVEYRERAIILGRRGASDPALAARAERAGVDLLQRRSGGGAVLAGPWMLALDLLLPPDHALARAGIVAAFAAFGRTLCDALQAQGVACTLAGAAQFAAHNAAAKQAGLDWVCFAGLSHGELLDAQGGKLLGLAQSRGRWGCLLSAGVLLARTPWETLEAIHHGRPCTQSAMHGLASVGLAALAPQMSPQRIRRALGDAVLLELMPRAAQRATPELIPA